MARKTAKSERGQRAEIGTKQRAYLRDTFKELGISASRAATLVGLSPSTFTRFMSLPDSSEKTLHPATLDKVEQLRQVNSDSPIPTKAQGEWGSLREDAELFIVHGHHDTPLVQALLSLIGEREGIVPWRLHTRALELEGFMPGDIVLVDERASPRPGDAVYATVQDRTKADPIMRQFQNVGGVNLLVPRTSDPRPPVSLVVDQRRVMIRGVLLPHRLRGRVAA